MSDLASMFQKAQAFATSQGGGAGKKRSGSVKGIFANLEPGSNRLRLGGAFVFCAQHYVKDMLRPERVRGGGGTDDDTPRLSQFLACLNWDIDKIAYAGEEQHCCPICDLRNAARMFERKMKNETIPNKEEMLKQYSAISGGACSRMRYLWPCIMRNDPFVTVTDANGQETQVIGWKVLGIGAEAHKSIEGLYKNYPQLAAEAEGCDIDIFKTKGARTTYSASYALSGASIAISPLTEEEKAMEVLDMARYIGNHPSPRALFQAMKPELQQVITEALGKTAESYPAEPLIKRANANGNSAKTEGMKQEASVKRAAANAADDFDAPSPHLAPQPTRAAAKTPAAPAPAAPKAAAPAPRPPPPPMMKPPAPPPPPRPPAPPLAAPAAAAPAAPAADFKPACFGTCDPNDNECKRCQLVEGCQTATAAK